jgi:hypothetical protein
VRERPYGPWLGAELCGWEQLACLNSTALTEN